MSDEKARQSGSAATGPGPAAAGNGNPPAGGPPPPEAPSGSPSPNQSSTPATPPPPPGSDTPAEASSLEIMPDSAPAQPSPAGPTTPPGAPGQLAVIPPPGASRPPIPPTPIDYAMPSQRKSWLPTPQMVKNLGCIFKMLFGFTVLLILGYVMLMAMNPKARQWALQGSKPGGAGAFPGDTTHGFAGTGIGGGNGPTPFKAVNQILAIPAQALGKTDDVVKANNARVGMLEGVITEEEGRAKAGASRQVVNPFAAALNDAAKGATPGAPGAKGAPGAPLTPEEEKAAAAARLLALQEKLANLPQAGTATARPDAVRPTAMQVREPEALAPVTLPGGVVIRNDSPAGAPAATRAFFYWVVNLNISGINPPRLLLNNRLVHEGQEVNIPLGVIFERLDSDAKLLVFRDKTGAVVTRSY